MMWNHTNSNVKDRKYTEMEGDGSWRTTEPRMQTCHLMLGA